MQNLLAGKIQFGIRYAKPMNAFGKTVLWGRIVHHHWLNLTHKTRIIVKGGKPAAKILWDSPPEETGGEKH